MRKHHENAVLIFARTPKSLDRLGGDSAFAALSWEDLDMLFTAMLTDLVRNIAQIFSADIIIYRNPSEFSDDLFLPYRQKIQLADWQDGSLPETMQAAVENAFRLSYHRIVVLCDNNPMIGGAVVHRMFDQLRYEDDCFVIATSPDGGCSMVGMKTDHSDIFDMPAGSPSVRHEKMLRRICEASGAMVFPVSAPYLIDSTANIARLKTDLELHDRTHADYPSRTSDIMRILDKKYKVRKVVR